MPYTSPAWVNNSTPALNASNMLDLSRAAAAGYSFYNVKHPTYGAAGDGVTDDSTEITAAIDAANSAGGGVVFFPKGTYRWAAGSKTIPSNITLKGGPGVTILLDTALAGGVTRAPFELWGGSNVVFEDLKFNITVANSCLGLFEYDNVRVERCYFTGSGAGWGVITVRTDSGADCVGLRVLNCDFVDVTGNAMYSVHLNTTTAGRDITDTLIAGNRFLRVDSAAVKFTAVDGSVLRTRIVGNSFVDISRQTSNYGFAVWGGLDDTYVIEDVLIDGNQYLSTLNEPKIFAALYSMRRVKIVNNTAVDSGTDTDTTFFAPGRTTDPIEHVEVAGNHIKGFGSFWDPDSMRYVTVHDNTVEDCQPNGGLAVGYSIQEYVDIHDNIFLNSYWTTSAAAISISNVDPAAKKVTVHHNLIIDDQGTPAITRFVWIAGAGAETWDASDVTITDNRVKVPSGTVTDGVTEAVATTVAPLVYGPNEIHDSANRRPVGGIPSLASATTVTLTGDSTLYEITGTTTITSVSASWRNRVVMLKFAGILTFTDGSNLILAGNFTTSADDTITLVCNGTNWYEVARSAN